MHIPHDFNRIANSLSSDCCLLPGVTNLQALAGQKSIGNIFCMKNSGFLRRSIRVVVAEQHEDILSARLTINLLTESEVNSCR